MNFQ
jgi:hypothetical protein